MRRFLPALATLLFLLSACNNRAGVPAEYRRIPVPEKRLASLEAQRHGRELFLKHCSICHGERADGRGARRNLSSRPQDLTHAFWQGRSSPRWIYYVIREGRRGTAMAGWKSLSPAESWDLVAYILSLRGSVP